MNSAIKLAAKAKPGLKSENKLLSNEKSTTDTCVQNGNDLKIQYEQLRFQNRQLQRSIKDLESKCESILRIAISQPEAGDSTTNVSFAGFLKQPLKEIEASLVSALKKRSDAGMLSTRVEELETRLTANYEEITKLLRIKMRAENCLQQILTCDDVSVIKDIAQNTLDECNDVYLFTSRSESRPSSTPIKPEHRFKTQNNCIKINEALPQLIKPEERLPGDIHISKIDPNLKKHIFYELNKETRKGNDWRLLAERVGIEKAIIDAWKLHKQNDPMANVWSMWGKSPGATVRMIHRHLVSPQMKNSLLARKISDFYVVS